MEKDWQDYKVWCLHVISSRHVDHCDVGRHCRRLLVHERGCLYHTIVGG